MCGGLLCDARIHAHNDSVIASIRQSIGMEGDMTALAASSPMNQLETALREYGIQVSYSAVQQFPDQRQ